MEFESPIYGYHICSPNLSHITLKPHQPKWFCSNKNKFTYCNQRSSIVSNIYRESLKTLSTHANKPNWWTLSASLYLQKDLKQFLFHTAKLVSINLEGEKKFKMPRGRPVLHFPLFFQRKNQWVGVWYSQKIKEPVKEPSTLNHWFFWVHNLPRILWNFSKAWNQQLLYDEIL